MCVRERERERVVAKAVCITQRFRFIVSEANLPTFRNRVDLKRSRVRFCVQAIRGEKKKKTVDDQEVFKYKLSFRDCARSSFFN